MIWLIVAYLFVGLAMAVRFVYEDGVSVKTVAGAVVMTIAGPVFYVFFLVRQYRRPKYYR